MNCKQVSERLDDHIDGALAPEERREVDRHLRDCPDCAEERRRLRRLVADLAALPTHIDPPRDLWPQIDRQLDRPARPEDALSGGAWYTRWQPLAAAAALLIVTVTAVVLIMRSGGDAGSILAPIPRAELVSGTHDAQAPKSFADAEDDLKNAKQSLRARLDTQRETLSPRTVAVIDQNLLVIDGAISEIESALARDPNNPELQRMLVAQHTRELDLLKQVNQFAAKRQRSEQ